jgi:recombination protein RecA
MVDVKIDKTKKRALDVAMASLKKTWGSDAFLDPTVRLELEAISTGSVKLDDAIGIGGLPEGRIVEVFGAESSGKTTVCTLLMAAAQQKYPDAYVGMVDVENAFNLEYANELGLDTDNILFSQPDGGEQALDTLLKLIESGACSCVVLDSVGGLLTARQLEGEVGKETMGELPRLLSQNMKKISNAAKATGTLVVFINQIRMKMVQYGNPETTMGGNALKYWSSVRLEIKRAEVLKKGELPIGQNVKIKLVKNKVGRPFGVVDTSLFFGIGFDALGELVAVSISRGLIDKGGAWLWSDKYLGPDMKIQGAAKLKEYLSTQPDIVERLTADVFNPVEVKEIKVDKETGEILNDDDKQEQPET